jgi:hypothetical protein
MKICKEHQKEDRALCFAFILYRERDPQIHTVLGNEHFWNALDEISGKYLTVFSFVKEEKGRPIEYMTAIKSMLKPSEASDTILEKYFSFPEKVKYPSILFFQVTNQEIINPFVVPLKELEQGKAFLEIKKIMETAEETLMRITDENKKNHKEIIELLRNAIEGELTIKALQGKIKAIGNVIMILKPLRHLIGSV